VALAKKGFYEEAQSAEQNALSCTNWCRSDYIVSLVEIYRKQNQLWKAESLLRRALVLFEDGTGLHLLGTNIMTHSITSFNSDSNNDSIYLATIIEQQQQQQQQKRDRLDVCSAFF
jgi:hypothetical protein